MLSPGYYMRARYYDPAVGQFYQLGPAGSTRACCWLATAGEERGLPWAPQQLNPYSYSLNNPVVNRDPSRLEDWRIAGGR